MATNIKNTPLRFPDLLIPKKEIDLYTWAVIACDQFTSNDTYWNEVYEIVGDAPSTLSLMVPELYFERESYHTKLASVRQQSQSYKDQDIFDCYPDSMIITDRQSPRVPNRKGIVLQLDLNEYDPNPEGNNVVKTTESIIESRLPKRIETRNASGFDISHVLMVYEDREHTLITQLQSCITDTAYKTALMMKGGHIHAQFCNIESAATIIADFFQKKIGKSSDKVVLAVGDGNHSLMSAKRIWKENGADMNAPDRWALVELVNIYDEGLEVEPIHRILFGAHTQAILKTLENQGTLSDTKTEDDVVTILYDTNKNIFWTPDNSNAIAVEVIESIIQGNDQLYDTVDFIHNAQEVINMTSDADNTIGIIFPDFDRDAIFKMVRNKKYFPRKSFSLGQGEDKKYYIEVCAKR